MELRIMKNVLTNYPLLRVLTLDCPFPVVPDEIGNLIHLRHLYISDLYGIIKLPDSIKNLRNLLSFKAALSVRGTSLNLKQMKELRYLSIGWSCVEDDDEEPLNLHHLRNLKVLSNISAGAWMMIELKLLSQTLEKLGIADIKSSKQLDMICECPSIVLNRLETGEFQMLKLQDCNKLQKLRLEGVIAAKSVPLAFPPYLLKLTLKYSKIEDQDSFVDALVRLPYLKSLRLQRDAYVGSQLNFPANSMMHLQELILWDLFHLEEIQVKEGAMPLLKSLYIIGIRFKVLPQHSERLREDSERDIWSWILN